VLPGELVERLVDHQAMIKVLTLPIGPPSGDPAAPVLMFK